MPPDVIERRRSERKSATRMGERCSCLIDPELGVLYPRLIEVRGRCPPEDSGGPWGYMEMLEAVKDPKHERHVKFSKWRSENFEPNDSNDERFAEEVAVLAKGWSRKLGKRRMSYLTHGPHRRVTSSRVTLTSCYSFRSDSSSN